MRTVLPLLFAGVACVSPLAAIEASDVERARAIFPTATAESLAAGRELFAKRCNTCHALPNPETRTHESWKRVVEEMSVRAMLNERRKELVLQYLATFARDAPAVR